MDPISASQFTPAPTLRTQRRRTPLWIRLIRSALLLCGLLMGMCLLLAWDTVRPKHQRMTYTPKDLNLPYEGVAFTSSDGTPLKGWFVPATGKAKGVVVCCHGVDSTRMAMLEPGHILHDAGYAVLLFDFRARGESGGDRCTLGYRETDDLLAAIAYVQSRPDMKRTPLGVLGESMGGAVALMGTARSPIVRCVIAESPFASLDHAVANHFHEILGGGGPILGAPTQWFGERLIGKSASDIAPLREIGVIAPRPLLLIEDSADRLCPTSETQALLQAAGDPKQVWTVAGADHVGAIDTQPDAYARHLVTFFNTHLR